MLQVLMQTSEETAFLMSLQSVLSLSLLKFSCNFFLWNALSRSADLFTYTGLSHLFLLNTYLTFSRKSSLSWKLWKHFWMVNVCSSSRIPLPSHHSTVFILQLLLEALVCEELPSLHGLALFQFQETLSAKVRGATGRPGSNIFLQAFLLFLLHRKFSSARPLLQSLDYKNMGYCRNSYI